MKPKLGRRRLRLFVLLSGALILASLVPLLVSDAALIRRNRRALEVLEEKYLTRSSSALADRIAAYHASNSVRLSRELTGENPFTSKNGPEILRTALKGETPLLALRGVNHKGIGSFAGPATLPMAVEFEFRRAFESARDGAFYSGDPFDAPPIGAVSVLAEPVSDEDGLIGVVEALVSWQPIRREFNDEARRDVRATLVDRNGRVLFPLTRSGPGRSSSSLVADFERFPGRVTRSETQPGRSVLASIAPVGRPEWGVLLERDLDAPLEELRSHCAGQIETPPDRARGREKTINRRKVHAPRVPRRVCARQAPEAARRASASVTRMTTATSSPARDEEIPSPIREMT